MRPIVNGSGARLRALGLIFIAGCTGISPRGPAPTLPGTVFTVVSAQAAIDRVWPGFWPESQAFLVYQPDGDAMLYSPGPPPAAYAHYRPPSTGPAVQPWLDMLYWHEGVPPGLYGLYDTAFRIGETTATAVALQDTLDATLRTLFHETFHAYQQRHFRGESAGLGFIAPATITDTMMATAEVERRILREALQASDRGTSRELAWQYLAVRASRNRETPAKAHQIEREVERLEGSAQLVGLQAAIAVLDRTPDAVAASVDRDLATPLSAFGGGLSERMFRWRLYGTGAAIGLLLDRFGAVGWRERLEQDGSFEALLAAATGFNDVTQPEALARQALERFDFASLRVQAAAQVAAGAQPSFDADVRVVVVVPEQSASRLRGSFNGTFTALEENLVLIDADLYTAEMADFQLIARGRRRAVR